MVLRTRTLHDNNQHALRTVNTTLPTLYQLVNGIPTIRDFYKPQADSFYRLVINHKSLRMRWRHHSRATGTVHRLVDSRRSVGRITIQGARDRAKQSVYLICRSGCMVWIFIAYLSHIKNLKVTQDVTFAGYNFILLHKRSVFHAIPIYTDYSKVLEVTWGKPVLSRLAHAHKGLVTFLVFVCSANVFVVEVK